MVTYYSEKNKMSELICDEPSLLQMMCRFGIPLGVGESSVRDICRENGVDVPTFLAVANFIKFGSEAADHFAPEVSVPQLISYLKQAHSYFLDFQLPAIRRKLIEAILSDNETSGVSDVANLIVKFYDEYMAEVRRHTEHENQSVFGYVEDLLEGRRSADFEIEHFARSHSAIDSKLQELKNIIIKYYRPGEAAEKLNIALYEIFICERDLRKHCQLEDLLFVPAVKALEDKLEVEPAADDTQTDSGETLSVREKDVLALLVCGFSNKEIADKLFISINTVQTHRKNIVRKLDIHSVSGLTIYAIVNGIVKLEQLNLNDIR
ncbi:MAG: helix-turn-helix transcriptional regulator [Bacteroidales bacterium]|nr:helix-turn-helix transcriptional regulator [Bacteroidales bacterium]